MTLSVLVVDDNRLIANSICQMLTVLDYEAKAVFGSMQAFHALNQQVPDVLLTDIHMQGLNGVEFCRSLRRDPRFANMIIVAISTDNQGSMIEEVREAGADGFLPKPIQLEELETFMKRIEQVLAKRQES